MNRVVITSAVAVSLAFALVGCTSEAPLGPTPSPLPTSAASHTPESLIATCDDLVSVGDQKKYEAAGWAFSDDFIARMVDQKSHLATFVEYGGALCQWGVPNSDASDVFAGSEINAAQQAEQRGYLEAEGFTHDSHNGADRYTFITDGSYEQIYLFAGNYWFYGSSASAADSGRQFADVG